MQLEALEPRRLMSATFNEGSLTVTGTDAADVISVRQRGRAIVVVENGRRSTFDVSAFRNVTINVFGEGGDDRINTAGMDFRCSINGGDGGDRIVGGRADDSLAGGGGNDVVRGGGGNDTVAGGRGDDRLSGGAGDDFLYDWTGSDRLAGGPGTDRAEGIRGRQRARGIEDEQFAEPPAANPIRPTQAAVSVTGDGRLAEVRVSLADTSYVVRYGEVVRAGNDISVEGVIEQLPVGGALTVIVTQTDTFPLGRLGPGSYTFTLRTLDGAAVATHAFRVGAGA